LALAREKFKSAAETFMKCDTIPDLEKFLKIQEQALGAEAAEVATTASKLADLYFQSGQYDHAEKLYNRALAIRRNLTGVHKSEIQDSEESLARLQAAKSPVAPAHASPSASFGGTTYGSTTQSSTNVKPIVDPLFISHSPVSDNLTSVTILSESSKTAASAKVRDAIHEAETELELLRQMAGPEHPTVADMLTHIADLYCRVRAYPQMEPFLLEALRIRENSSGGEHPLVSTELKNLARLYIVQERYAMAEPLLKRALSIREHTFGKSHPRVADIEEQYAIVLRKTNRAYQAEALERHVGEIRNAQGGDAPPIQVKQGISKAN
jgi:tetratricopeptide (TPR) repeat protein